MEGLATLNLQHLDLSYNCIRRIEGIKVGAKLQPTDSRHPENPSIYSGYKSVRCCLSKCRSIRCIEGIKVDLSVAKL